MTLKMDINSSRERVEFLLNNLLQERITIKSKGFDQIRGTLNGHIVSLQIGSAIFFLRSPFDCIRTCALLSEHENRTDIMLVIYPNPLQCWSALISLVLSCILAFSCCFKGVAVLFLLIAGFICFLTIVIYLLLRKSVSEKIVAWFDQTVSVASECRFANEDIFLFIGACFGLCSPILRSSWIADEGQSSRKKHF